VSSVVIGCDPDSEKHGIAIYINGELVDLKNLTLPEIVFELIDGLLVEYGRENIQFSIENVCANNFTYSRNEGPKEKVQRKKSLNLGRCQQSQTELMRMLDYLGIQYTLFKPQKGNWAETKNKNIFKLATKWKKRSNDDNRSAAFFGYLLIRQNKKNWERS